MREQWRARPAWRMWWRLVAITCDATAVILALVLATMIRYGSGGLPDSLRGVASAGYVPAPWPEAVFAWMLAFWVAGLYDPVVCRNAVVEARRLMLACVGAPAIVAFFGLAEKNAPSRTWLALGAVLAVVTTGAGRRVLHHVAVRARRRGKWVTRALVVGGESLNGQAAAVQRDSTVGFILVGVHRFASAASMDDKNVSMSTAVAQTNPEALLVLAADLSREEIGLAIAAAHDLGLELFVLPGLDHAMIHRIKIVPVGGEPALAMDVPSLSAWQRVVKRTTDLTIGTVALLLAAPVMAVVALAVRVSSPGPVLFHQRRVGLRGREFSVLKFRTMVDGAHQSRTEIENRNEAGSILFKVRDDPRVTPVGRCLRRFSLDELPQLFNVLRGDMSLVGPRPPLPDEVAMYDGLLRRRLTVRPGITGLWQIKGRSDLPFEDYVRLDLTYVQNWNALLDMYILLRTGPAVLRRRGAY